MQAFEFVVELWDHKECTLGFNKDPHQKLLNSRQVLSMGSDLAGGFIENSSGCHTFSRALAPSFCSQVALRSS